MIYNVINQVTVLMMLLSIGIFLRKKNIITDQVNKGISNILTKIALPCLILSSFNFKFSKSMMESSIKILIYSIIIHIILIVSSNLIFIKYKDYKKTIFKFCMIFSNCGFVGYPIIQALYGSKGVFYTSIFTIPQNIIIWTYGLMLFSGEKGFKSLKKNLLNGPIICVFIGSIIFLLSITIPTPLLDTLKSVGNMTTPLSMFTIGAMLADSKPLEMIKDINLYLVSFMKLIASPLITGILLIILNADKDMIYICSVLISMPAAVLLGVFAEKYDKEKETASKCVFVTTIFSLVTIPLIITILNKII